MSKHEPGHVGEVTTELCSKCADNKAPATIIIINLIPIIIIIHTTTIFLIFINIVIAICYITINRIIITSEHSDLN